MYLHPVYVSLLFQHAAKFVSSDVCNSFGDAYEIYIVCITMETTLYGMFVMLSRYSKCAAYEGDAIQSHAYRTDFENGLENIHELSYVFAASSSWDKKTAIWW